jgi:copper chaperone CopZ
MKLLSVLILLSGLFVGCMNQQGLETATVKANSMVCETCAKNVKDAVFAVEGVKSVDVDMKKKIVIVQYVPAQTNLQTLERAITDAGYDANDKKRDQAAYDKLDACCKIDG